MAAINPDPIENEVRGIVLAVQEMMPSHPDGWVPWRAVSRHLTGSAASVELYRAYAELPDYTHLFHQTPNVVKLSEAGIEFAAFHTSANLSEVQIVAASVRGYAALLKPLYLKVSHIAPVAKVSNKFVHAVFELEGDEPFSSETPVEYFSQAGWNTRGKTVGVDPATSVLYIAFENEILPAYLPGSIKIDRGYLLSILANKIGSLPEMPGLIAPMFLGGGAAGIGLADEDSGEVALGLAALPVPWTRLLWGPPGAGKTYALGRLIMELVQANPLGRILVVAPSNRAVDVAIEQLVAQLDHSALAHLVTERKILRFGYPRRTHIVERSELLGPEQLDALTRKVRTLAAQITKAEAEQVQVADLAVMRAELLGVQEEVKDAVAAHIQQCTVVGTTATLAYMPASPIGQMQWDTVLVDEATMVTPAMCVWLASLATQRLLLAGDPRQLGPVFEGFVDAASESYEWMGRDIFAKSGVSSGTGEHHEIAEADTRLARITSQRRCAPQIWERIESLYPSVINLADDTRFESLAMLGPCAGQAVAVLDTSGKCCRVKGSWQNEFSADLALEIATTIASDAGGIISVAIITPYRSQVRLLGQRVTQERKGERVAGALVIDIGTVHQFQGSDSDVVVFDMVDGRGRSNLGALLRGDTGMRLVNVAISRAKGKLVVLADRDWCRSAFQRMDNPLLWDLLMEREAEEVCAVEPALPLVAHSGSASVESPIEAALYTAMLNVTELSTVVPQFIIRDESGTPVSRADFAFPEFKYAVFCDGKQWHVRVDRWQRDWRQRNRLTELGWRFTVFTGSDVVRSPSQCAAQVLNTLRKLKRGG